MGKKIARSMLRYYPPGVIFEILDDVTGQMEVKSIDLVDMQME